MTPPPSAGPAPGRHAIALDGHLHLTATRDAHDGRTALAHQSFRAPFHIGKAYWDGAVLQVRVVNPTAGILQGDALELDVRVDAGASLLVTTPAATRAYMMRSGAAVCRQMLEVATGGWLEYVPEPLYPHRETNYTQTTRLVVAPGAEAVLVDALAPGRVARGERWAWSRLRLALDVEAAGEPILRERLDASGAELGASAAFFGTPEAWFATVVVISGRIAPDHPVVASVRALHARERGLWVGITRLRRAGWIVRIIAPGGLLLRDTLDEVRRLLATVLPALGSDLRRV